VAITAEVFQFISTHWRPVPPSKTGSGSKPESGANPCSAGNDSPDADDVEMIDTDACTTGIAPAAGGDGADATEAADKQDDGGAGMDIDENVATGGDGKAASAKEDSMLVDEDDDDDVIIAVPSADGSIVTPSGQVCRAMQRCSIVRSGLKGRVKNSMTFDNVFSARELNWPSLLDQLLIYLKY
jgi:hypothetical protein